MRKPLKKKRSLGKSLGIATIAAILFIFIVSPFIFMFLTSFKKLGEVMRYPPTILPDRLYLGNFQNALNSYLPKAFLNSLIITLLSVAVTLLLALPASYAFSRLRFPGRNFFFMATLSTMMLPSGLMIVPMFEIVKNLPMPGSAYGWIDTAPGLIFPFLSVGFVIFYVRQYFLGIPREMDEAARVDGANKLQILLKLILPLSKPAVSLAIVFSFMNKWNDYLWSMAVTRTEKMYTIQIAIKMFQGRYHTDWPMMLAGAVIAVVPVILIYFCFQKLFEQGLSGASAGLKE